MPLTGRWVSALTRRALAFCASGAVEPKLTAMVTVGFRVPVEVEARVNEIALERGVTESAAWREVVLDGLAASPDFRSPLEKLVLVNSLVFCLVDRLAGKSHPEIRRSARTDLLGLLKELGTSSPDEILRHLAPEGLER